jgi:hypothetical protein
MMNLPNHVLAQIAQQYANGNSSPIHSAGGGGVASITEAFAKEGRAGQGQDAPRYTILEESWKHHA